MTAWQRPGLRRERWLGPLFLAVPLLYLAAVVLLPLVQALYSSTLRIRGLNATFVGLGNYARVLASDSFWTSLGISFRFTATCVILHLVLGFGLALLLQSAGRARALLRLLLLTPWMVAPAIAATIWLWLLEPNFGVLSYLLNLAGLGRSGQSWLGEPSSAFGAVVLVDVWRGVPFVMLLLSAGLQTVPREQYEAAMLDGANAVQQFRHVTLPNVGYIVAVAATLDTINTVRQFDIIAVLTGGGPAGATEVLPVLLYNTGFRANDLGGAAAIGTILLLVVLALATLNVAITGLARTRS